MTNFSFLKALDPIKSEGHVLVRKVKYQSDQYFLGIAKKEIGGGWGGGINV